MHNHPTAYEFLGGRAHCGKPWDRFVYATKNGKVSVVGVASLPAGHSKATLKRYLKPLR